MSKGKQWTVSIASLSLMAAALLWGQAARAEGENADGATDQTAPAYKLDTVHTSVVFRVTHLGMSHVWGRFNEVGGDFAFSSAAPHTGHFKFAVKAASVDTNNAKRDEHLRNPDFFNAAQFPLIAFRSTAITPGDEPNTYVVSGEMELHGVKQPITLTMTRLGESEDQRGKRRIGFATQFTIQRSAFGVDYGLEGVSDDVELFVSFEGTR